MPSLITAITENVEAASFLTWPGDFELDRKDHVEDVHLASGRGARGFRRRRFRGHLLLLR
ncbi:hypothetical protein AB0869_31675 [Micromonospora vinacea]|uniref:hypothetical protein n=1 Tax=Micromonospora vinacea TaxID=709878 RepID=UPI0034559451